MKKQSRSTSQRLKELHDIPAHNDHQAWIKRLSKSCKDSSKVRDLLFNTQMAMIDRYFTAEQLRYLLLRYHGSKEEKKDIAILGFSRIVDLRNFDIVLEIFSQEEQANLIARLGVLNCWNPLKPDGYIECDIGRREERQVARMLVALAEAEPGKNFLNESFRWNRVEPPMPGWVLPETWFKEETLPHRGVLCVEYYSGEGRGLNGCAPEVELRLALAGVVTLCEPDPEALQDYPDLVFDQTRTKIWLDQLNLRLDFTAGVPRVGALT